MISHRFPLHSAILAGLLAGFTFIVSPAHAKSLDDFNATAAAGWEDSNPINLPLKGGVQADGKFTFVLPPLGQAYFVASKKTSETFELKEGRTIEFRVDMVSGLGQDSFTVLGFIPQATGPNSLAGYGIAKSETDMLITKGIGKYFYNENPTPAVKNNNVTLVLNLSVRGGNVHIHGQVLDKDDANRVIWEKQFVDTPAADVFSDGKDDPPAPFLNLVGNFVLYLYADGGKAPAGYQVVYDNAQTFVTDSASLDDFNAAARTSWEDSNPINLPLKGGQQADGKFTFGLPALGQAYFVASKKTSKSFELTEGTRHEFSVDLLGGQGPDSFAVLAFIPNATGPNTLAGYGLAKSETDMLITKGIGKYFYNEDPTPAIKNTDVRLTLSLTVIGGQVIINGRVLDKSDSDRVIFDRTYVDTAAADVFADGKDDPPAPFVGLPGTVVLYLYADGGKDPTGYQVVYDNLAAATPPSLANEPPILSEITPSPGANFLAASEKLSFKIADDKQIPDAGVRVTLNGTKYTTANGLTLTASAAGNSRTATLGGFEANKDYSGEIAVTDADNATRTAVVFFDTFTSATRIVEVEDYNFEAGGYLNSPVLIPEGSLSDSSYSDRIGTRDVDYFDTRPNPSTTDSMYRTQDAIRMAHSLDRRRPSYDEAQNIWDYDVGDFAAGEWMNYTRDFTDGTYEIFLREAVVNMPQGDSVLERVTSNPNVPEQTVEPLGTFLAKTSGYTFRNVPLTDGAGLNRIKARLSGKVTLRLRTVTPDSAGAARLHNYLSFLPVADAGIQRATVASLSPAADSTLSSATPKIEVIIQNRDTRVDVATIKLTVNNAAASSAVVTFTSTGATVSYAITPLPAPGSLVSASVAFKDNDGVEIRTDWKFTVTYNSLDPATRISGTGRTRGFKLHVVQAPAEGGALENSLDRAESQLAANSTIPRSVDSNTVAQIINFNKRPGQASGNFPDDLTVPGIDPDVTGNGDNDFAVEILSYLELPAGVHRFGAITDDGYKIASGPQPVGAGAPPLAFHNGGPADETFEFVVHQAGLYAFRMVWYERGGAGHGEWFSVDTATGENRLINGGQPGAIPAWSEIEVAAAAVVVESAAVVQGPYAKDASAVVNASTRTATIPLPNTNRFYRLNASASYTLKASVQGANLILTW